MKRLILAAGIGFAVAAPASAVSVCSVHDITPTAQACTGFFSGNLLSGRPGDITAQKTDLAALGYTWDGNFATVEKIASLGGSHLVDFTTLLHGISYVAFHFGNGRGGPGQATAFYRLDAGAATDVITLAYNASSDAVLYSTQAATGTVPEPASWALMIAGFGLVGVAARRRSGAVAA